MSSITYSGLYWIDIESIRDAVPETAKRCVTGHPWTQLVREWIGGLIDEWWWLGLASSTTR